MTTFRPPPGLVLTRRFTPPAITPATVFGEICADGTKIVITFSGDQWPCERAIDAVEEMTPKGTVIAGGLALTMPLTWPTYIQLACTFGRFFSPGGRLRQWFLEELARRTGWRDRPLRYRLPAGLTLREWQPESVRNVAHLGCLLEDDPRLGKSCSAIVGLAERACWPEYPSPLPIIVICPASVVTHWVREFERFAPHWRVLAWRGGNTTTRTELVGTADVYVASYAIARRDAKAGAALRDSPLARIKPATVIIDEYHFCGNPDSIQTRAAQRLARMTQDKRGLVIPLSGTPFDEDINSAHPVWEVFEPRAYPSRERINARWWLESKADYGYEYKGINRESEHEFRTCFLGRQLRRSRQDVAPWLSEKTYSTRVVPIPDKYLKEYRRMEQRMIAELDNGEECTPMSTITKVQRLQQLAASACDMTRTYTTDDITGLEVEHQHLHPRLPSWKVEAMLEVLAELRWPALAFGISRPLVVLAGEEARRQGARVGYVVGGQTARDRDADVDAFQAGKLDLLCVVVDAGGTGLTLNAAGTAMFLQRHYSYKKSIQAEDRGIGDRHPTLDIVDIVAEDSIDDRIRRVLHNKAAKLSEYFGDPRIVRALFGGEVKTA